MRGVLHRAMWSHGTESSERRRAARPATAPRELPATPPEVPVLPLWLALGASPSSTGQTGG
eukprot:2018658-Rhodomonas_salina.1